MGVLKPQAQNIIMVIEENYKFKIYLYSFVFGKIKIQLFELIIQKKIFN